MTPEERLLKLEGQVQALAQAWLHLAAVCETAGGKNQDGLSNALRQQRWRGAAFEPYALAMLTELAEQLDLARAHRSPGH